MRNYPKGEPLARYPAALLMTMRTTTLSTSQSTTLTTTRITVLTTILTTTLLILLAGSTAVKAEENRFEWPQYKGDAGNSGVSSDPSIKPPLKLLWSYRLDGDASGDAGAGITVAGNKVYANVNNSHSVVALDADTGRFAWEYEGARMYYKSVPTYYKNRLYLWDRERTSSSIITLNAATGKELWRVPLPLEGRDPSRGGLTIYQGKIYSGAGSTEGATMSCFDADSGKRLWRVVLGKQGGTHSVTPVVAAGKVFVSTRMNVREMWINRRKPLQEQGKGFGGKMKGETVALDAATGKVLWRRENIYSYKPMATDGKVLTCAMWASKERRYFLLDAETGETLWRRPGNRYYMPSTITKDKILLKEYGGRMFAVDRKTSDELWLFNGFTRSGCCSPSVSGNYAYLGTGVMNGDLEYIWSYALKNAPRERGKGGTIYAVDLRTGKPVWYFGTGNTVCGEPALAYGRVYFSSRDGRIYCFEPAEEDEPSLPEAKDRSPAVDPQVVATLLDEATDENLAPEKAWPMQAGNPTRTGLPRAAIDPDLELAWKHPTGGRILTSSVIRNGRVYIGSISGKLSALDLAGKVLWSYDADAAIQCSPAVAADLVYCGSDDGKFVALDVATGRPRWTFAAGGSVQASPTIIGGVVLFGAHDHNLYALNRHTGAKLWNFRSNGGFVQAPPVVAGDRVYMAQWHDWVWALDLKTGKKLWRSFVPVSIENLAYHGDRLYAHSPYSIIELDPQTGQRMRLAYGRYGYRGGGISYSHGGFSFLGNQIVQAGLKSQYGSNGATLTDLDQPGLDLPKGSRLTDIDVLKSSQPPGFEEVVSMARPLVLGDQICFSLLAGEIGLYQSGGKKLWSYKLGGKSHSSPVAADGLLVVGCDDGFLYAFRARPATTEKRKEK